MLLTTRSSSTIHRIIFYSLLGQLSSSSPFSRSHVNDREVENNPNVERQTFVNNGLNSGWLSLPRSSFINRGRFQNERASYLFPGINDGQPRPSHRRNEASDDNFMTYASMKNSRGPEDQYNYKNTFKNSYYDTKKDGFRPESQPKKFRKFSKNRKDKEDNQSEQQPQNLFEKKRVKNKKNDSYVYRLNSENIDYQKKTDDFRPSQESSAKNNQKVNQNYLMVPDLRPRHELMRTQIKQHPSAQLDQIKKDKVGPAISSSRTESHSNDYQRHPYPFKAAKGSSDVLDIQPKNAVPLSLIFHQQNYSVERQEIKQRMQPPWKNHFYTSTSSSQSLKEFPQKSRLHFSEELSTTRSFNTLPSSRFYDTTTFFSSDQYTEAGWTQTELTTPDERNNVSFPVDPKRIPTEEDRQGVRLPLQTESEELQLDTARPLEKKKNMLYEFLATSSPPPPQLMISEVTPSPFVYDLSSTQKESGIQPNKTIYAYRREIVWSPAELAFLQSKYPDAMSRNILSNSKKKYSKEAQNSSNLSSSNPNEYGPCALANLRLRKDHALYEKGKTHFLRKITDDVPAANKKSSSMVDVTDREDRTFFDRLEKSYGTFQPPSPKEESNYNKDLVQIANGDEVEKGTDTSQCVKRTRHKGKAVNKIQSEFLKGNEPTKQILEIVRKKPIKFTGEEDQLLDAQSPQVEQEKAK